MPTFTLLVLLSGSGSDEGGTVATSLLGWVRPGHSESLNLPFTLHRSGLPSQFTMCLLGGGDHSGGPSTVYLLNPWDRGTRSLKNWDLHSPPMLQRSGGVLTTLSAPGIMHSAKRLLGKRQLSRGI